MFYRSVHKTVNYPTGRFTGKDQHVTSDESFCWRGWSVVAPEQAEDEVWDETDDNKHTYHEDRFKNSEFLRPHFLTLCLNIHPG